MKSQINSITFTGMSNGAFFDYMRAFQTRINANTAVKAKAATEFATFEEKMTLLDTYMNLSRKNKLSDQIADSDKKRDDYYRGLRSTVKNFQKLPAGDLKDAADDLWQLLKDYNIDPTAQLNKESGLLENLISDLRSKYSTQVTTLGLTAFVDNLETANKSVQSLMIERDDAESDKVTGAVKAARLEVEAAYEETRMMLNAHSLVEGDDIFATLFADMNKQIERYKREVLGQKSSSSSSSSSNSGSSSSSGDGGSSSSGDNGGSSSDDDREVTL